MNTKISMLHSLTLSLEVGTEYTIKIDYRALEYCIYCFNSMTGALSKCYSNAYEIQHILK